MSLIADAIAAVQAGGHVFPCNPVATRCPESGDLIDKCGLLLRPDKPWKIRWSEAATQDIGQIVEWWSRVPLANIGLACKPSGYLIVDCDLPKRDWALRGTIHESLHDTYGPRPHGEDVLRALCQRYSDGNYAALTETRLVATGSGGLHAYYQWPSKVQASQKSPVPEFVDVRCNGSTNGGYVLAPGSITSKGLYRLILDAPVAPAPAWLVELVREKPKLLQPQVSGFRQPRGTGNYDNLVEDVRYAPEGTRQWQLHRAAWIMAGAGATQHEAETTLLPAAREAQLSDYEATSTIARAYRQQTKG